MNGSEIFDLAEKFSDKLQKLSDIGDLQTDIRKLKNDVCGNCDLWMKYSLCPKEYNVNGHNKGPSISEISCAKFIRNKFIDELINEKEKVLKDMIEVIK